MLLNYLDESGVPEKSGSTTHFVLLALAVPATSWRIHDGQVQQLKLKYGLVGAEIHTGWLARRYIEQERIPNFAQLPWDERRKHAILQREAILLHAVATKPRDRLQELQKNFRKTFPYIHLTSAERYGLLRDMADLLGRWTDCVLFCNAVDKTSFGGTVGVLEHAFTNVVARIQHYITTQHSEDFGMLIADRNETTSVRLTDLMRDFYRRGAGFAWRRRVDRIVETPLFVDSSLTGMIQLADLCAYAVRRFCENNEVDLFDRIYPRFPQIEGNRVTIRHSTGVKKCQCRICLDHGRYPPSMAAVTAAVAVTQAPNADATPTETS